MTVAARILHPSTQRLLKETADKLDTLKRRHDAAVTLMWSGVLAQFTREELDVLRSMHRLSLADELLLLRMPATADYAATYARPEKTAGA